LNPANDNFIRPESGKEAAILTAATIAAAVGGVVIAAVGTVATGETIVASGAEAVGPLITSEKAAAVARTALASPIGRKLTSVFTGQKFRLGVSRAKDGGRFVLRAAGSTVQRILGRPKIDIIDLGPIEEFMKATKK